MEASRLVRQATDFTASTRRGIYRPPGQIVATGDHDDVGMLDGRQRVGDPQPGPDRGCHVSPIHRGDFEPVIGTEAVRLGEDLAGPGDIQHRHVVEDDDDHHSRVGSCSHGLIVSHIVGNMAPQTLLAA